MSLAYDQQAVLPPPAAAVKKPTATPAPTVEPAAPPPEHHGLWDRITGAAASGLGAVEHAGATVENRLLGGVNEQHGPSLNGFWNHLFGGPGPQAGDGRPLTTNHIGTQAPGPVQENGTISNLMRSTPYLGDYWESLSVTHDSAHVKNPILDGITAITNVALPGPLMGLVDAPFRAAGTSLFLDKNSLQNK